MTVLEVVRKHGLERADKTYKDQYGVTHNTDIPVNELLHKKVKSITIYPFFNEAEIVIII